MTGLGRESSSGKKSIKELASTQLETGTGSLRARPTPTCAYAEHRPGKRGVSSGLLL